MKLLQRIRDAWRRSGKQADQHYAEDMVAQREADLHSSGDNPLPVSRTNSDWTYIPPP
jgi:UV DNA damage repair endonuclease